MHKIYLIKYKNNLQNKHREKVVPFKLSNTTKSEIISNTKQKSNSNYQLFYTKKFNQEDLLVLIFQPANYTLYFELIK